MTTFLFVIISLLTCKLLWPSKKVKAKVTRILGETEIMKIDRLYKVNDVFRYGYFDYKVIEIAPQRSLKEKSLAFLDYLSEVRMRLKKII